MIMLLDKTKIKFERQQRAWSQAQLAESSGMSLRTVQRIEKNGRSSLESAKALAAVFCLPVNQLYRTEFFDEEEGEQAALKSGLVRLRASQYLTSKAKTLSATAFLLLSLTFLLMSMVKIVSVAGAIGYSLILSIALGLAFDAIRNVGLYKYLKQYIQSEGFSIKENVSKLNNSLLSLVKFFKKPMLITGIVVAIAGSVTYLNMEDYQKVRFSVFFSELF